MRGSETAVKLICAWVWWQESVTDFWGGSRGRDWGWYVWSGVCGGRRGWRAHCHLSSGDIKPGIKHHGTSKGDARLLPASRTSSPHPVLFPLLPRRGADVAHSRQEGVMQKALQSPLFPTHDGLGTRRKRRESCVGREKGKTSVLEIYIATLKARIARGAMPAWWGEWREALGFLCQLPVLENGSLSQCPKHVLSYSSGCL